MISGTEETNGNGAGFASKRAGRRVGELFDEHGPSVLGLCRLILRDPVEAEDAAQQTFLSAHRALLRGTEPREPAAWLTAIARNECRARMRRRELVVVPRADDAVDRRDASDVASDRERMHAVAEAIADLPDRQRAAVVLRDLRGLSSDEVARTLAVEPAAVDALVYRGRSRVRRALRRSWPATVVVPVSLRDALARLIPHFETTGGAGAALLGAKLLAAPVAKVAAGVAAAVLAVGATAVEIERSLVAPTKPAPRAAPPRQATHVVAGPKAVASVERRSPSASSSHSAAASRHRGQGRGSRDVDDRDGGGRPEPAEPRSSSGPGPAPGPSDNDVSVSSGPGPAPAPPPAPSTQPPPRTDNSGPGSVTEPTVQADSSGPGIEADSSSSGPGPGPVEASTTSGSDGSNSGPGSTSSGSGSDSSGSDSSGSGSDGHGGSGE